MSKDRRNEILKAIIEIFIQTANPVGSKFLKEEADFHLSPATLRSEMARLEKEGFLMQSHTSSGRIPTTEAYRMFVNELSIEADVKSAIQKEFQTTAQKYFSDKKADQAVFDIISILTKMTPNIAFATIPSAKKTFFLGLSQIMEQPEFQSHPDQASGIFRILEEDLYDFLDSCTLSQEIELFIGRENILPGMESCSLLVSQFQVLDTAGYFGILGPVRMDYARNIVALEEAKNLFHMSNQSL